MRKSSVRVLAAVGAFVLVAACGSNDNNKKNNAAPSPSNGPATYAVGVDMNRADLSLPATETALAYFPSALSVHPGDTVTFGLNDSGEPHTVALGSVVDAVAVPYSKLTPAQKHADNPPPAIQAASKKVPQTLPEGPGDAIQAGAQPCYQATGLPPTKNACAVHTGDFTGTESLVSSGWLDANAPFTLKISDTAKPGQYHFYCQVHGPDMGGVLTVTAKDTQIPSPADVATTAETQLKADAAKLAGAAASLTKATAAKALAGAISPAFENGWVSGFGPTSITIPVGGSVTWTVAAGHTIFFNPPADAQQLRKPAPDGSVHLNAKAVMPVGGPGAPNKPGLFNGGKWNGAGPHSSGVIFSGPPAPTRYRLTFTKAGTYNFQCTIHVNMKGTVTVG